MLIYEPSYNNIEGKMSKVALAIEQQVQTQDFESSMELDPFSLFINAMRADKKKISSKVKHFF